MTQADEQKVLQSFYDRIFQMVTYTPNGGNNNVFDPKTTLIQLDTDGSINFSDYQNMVTPLNSNGDMRASEAFYLLSNKSGGIGATYQPTQNLIGDTYKEIVNGANSNITPSPDELNKYQNAKNYLFTTQTQKDPLTGASTDVQVATTVYNNYKTYMTLYLSALSAYRVAFLTYDMSKPEDQRKWEAQTPVLEGNLTKAYNDWVSLGNKDTVEEVLNFLSASNNNVVANMIDDAKSLVKNSQLSSSIDSSGAPWYLTYGMPYTWNDASAEYGWMTFNLNSNNLYTSDDSYYSKSEFSVGSNFLGLISWGASGQSSEDWSHQHMNSDNLSITCEMLTVTIQRPWLNDALFRTGQWYEKGQPNNWISNGNLDNANAKALLPVIPTAFVLVRNVQITANWTEQDSNALSKASSSSGSFSFGPFHSSASNSSGSSSSSSSSSFVGGVLSIPNPQIVAWVNEIVPASPQMDGTNLN